MYIAERQKKHCLHRMIRCDLLIPDRWRSLKLGKCHLTIPKRLQRIAMQRWFERGYVSHSLTFNFKAGCQWWLLPVNWPTNWGTIFTMLFLPLLCLFLRWANYINRIRRIHPIIIIIIIIIMEYNHSHGHLIRAFFKRHICLPDGFNPLETYAR